MNAWAVQGGAGDARGEGRAGQQGAVSHGPHGRLVPRGIHVCQNHCQQRTQANASIGYYVILFINQPQGPNIPVSPRCCGSISSRSGSCSTGCPTTLPAGRQCRFYWLCSSTSSSSSSSHWKVRATINGTLDYSYGRFCEEKCLFLLAASFYHDDSQHTWGTGRILNTTGTAL